MRAPVTSMARLLAVWIAMIVAVSARAGEVSIVLECFGAMRAYRPGDLTGIRLRLESSRNEPIECIAQWDIENADGDLVSHTRSVTLAPSQPSQVWLYARLPASREALLSSEVFTVRVFESRDGTRAREIGSLRFGTRDAEQASLPVGMHEGLIAALAGGRMGLEALEAVVNGDTVPSMNEVTRIASSLRVSDLPDRWEGLLPVEAVVWASDSPQSLSPDRATALLRWIERGGHLVVVLPESGDPWQVRGPSHPLAALLPARGAVRADGISIERALPVLTKSRSMRRGDFRMAATLFDEATIGRPWRTLVRLPDAAVPRGVTASALVVQRAWGHGRVTLVGLDLDALQRGAAVVDGAPQADVFWNAVLGRRADAPSEADYRAWQDEKPRSTLVAQGSMSGPTIGDERLVSDRIGQVGRATLGVLAVIGFFVAYWLAAVPGSWMLLRRRRRVGLAWPAFAAVAVLAAPVAWSLGLLFGGGASEVRHLTVADFVLPTSDAPSAGSLRANAWMSVALGGFGTTEIAIDAPPETGDLLLDWGGLEGRERRFPDTARNDRSIDRPTTVRAAARATTTDLQAWWAGSPPASWGRVAWQEEGRPVRTEVLNEGTPRVRLQGAIRHALPGPLREVRLLHVMPFRYETRGWTNGPGSRISPATELPPRPARMADLRDPWDGSALDLGKALYPDGAAPAAALGERSLVAEMRGRYARPVQLLVKEGTDPMTWLDRFSMLALFQMLEPPQYRTVAGSASQPEVARVNRRIGRGIDLSPWFVRPCVIVTGVLDAAECPVPLKLDGEVARSDGTVLVRLVIPLDEPDGGTVVPMTGNPVR